MRKLIAAYILLWALHLSAGTTTLTGIIRDEQGNPLNGTLVMRLPVPAQDPNTNTAIAPTPVTFQLINGQITGGAPLYDLATIQPSKLWYAARGYDTAGRLAYYGNFYITGATFNLGTATPVTVTTSNISYASPVSTSSNNNFTGTNTFAGPTTFTGVINAPTTITAGPSMTSTNALSVTENTTGTYSGDGIYENILSTGMGSFNGNFEDFQLNGQSFYKVTNAGTSIQIGTMYSKQVDTTLIADMFCTTPFNLDDSCINNAIAALPSTGGIINLSAGSYLLAHTITISKPVLLKGAGGSSNCTQTGCQIEPPYLPGTELKWNGATNAAMIAITPSGGNEAVGSTNLKNISIEGNSVAGVIGVDMNCMQFSQWDSVFFNHLATGMQMGCLTGSNTMLNAFTQIDMNQVSTGLIMDGPADGPCTSTCGDSFNNTFTHLHIAFTGTAGIDIKSADNNQFMELTIFRSSGVGTGIIFEAPSGSGTTARLGGTYEYIYHYQPTTTNGVSFNAGGNVIREYDIANGQAVPQWTGSHNQVWVTDGSHSTLVTDTSGGLFIQDANNADSTPRKGLTVNNGHFQLIANDFATVLLDIDNGGLTRIANGSNTVYRCATAGATLPVGSLTINAAACGTTTDTGLRVP